ncbi:endonuclease V [Gymnodinialimonas sp. 2305UL16-5]|uniref:endonuclease V n=1 Tax=Gymnodinialimonas mytili TaxID=3126503 RepID=UPI0030A7C9FB
MTATKQLPIPTMMRLREHLNTADVGNIEPLADMQVHLAERVICAPEPNPLRFVTGVDIAYSQDEGDPAHVAALTMDIQTNEIVECIHSSFLPAFPYTPGFLAYREVLPAADLITGLNIIPDVVLYDGNGTLHPRRCGAACYLGLLTDLPTVGVSKNPPMGVARNCIMDKEKYQLIDSIDIGLGAAVQTGGSTRAIYISIGHKAELDWAVGLVRRLSRFRLPEPLRLADIETRRVRDRPTG